MSFRIEKRPAVKQRVMFSLLMGFVLFTSLVYTKGTEAPDNIPSITAIGAEGRLLWQKYNCTACHQLYGLGGYLGPDLTDVMTAPGKGEAYVKAMLSVGSEVMPNYNLSSEEIEALTAFLRYVDSSGNFPERRAIRTWFGAYDIEDD